LFYYIIFIDIYLTSMCRYRLSNFDVIIPPWSRFNVHHIDVIYNAKVGSVLKSVNLNRVMELFLPMNKKKQMKTERPTWTLRSHLAKRCSYINSNKFSL